MGARRAWVAGVLLIVAFLLGGTPTPLRAEGHFGLSAGIYQPEDDELDNTEVFGVRGGYRFNPSLGFEASLSRVDLADTLEFEDDPFFPEIDFQLDLYNLDLSLQWFPRGSSFVIFAGPGLARFDAEVRATLFGQTISESDSSDIFTAHAGFGYVWQVGDRFFIRPEGRVRRYFDDDLDSEEQEEEGLAISYEATDYEVAVTFGWRFGS